MGFWPPQLEDSKPVMLQLLVRASRQQERNHHMPCQGLALRWRIPEAILRISAGNNPFLSCELPAAPAEKWSFEDSSWFSSESGSLSLGPGLDRYSSYHTIWPAAGTEVTR